MIARLRNGLFEVVSSVRRSEKVTLFVCAGLLASISAFSQGVCLAI